MAKSWKEWEGPLIELQQTISKLRALQAQANPEQRQELEARIESYEKRVEKYVQIVYSRLGPWEKVLVARAEPRPYTLDYVNRIFTDFVELEGDRRYGQDHAIVGGPADLDGRPVMVIGHQKGRNIQERTYRNFAMAKPEGYRKAIRLMEMADRFQMPVVSFVDTPAADPGVESESRGISEAIADAMLVTQDLHVPVVSVVIGEGGSGGAIALAAANRVLMLEHSIYSVIPPEGCAAILWRRPEDGAKAAAALRLTAQSAEELGIIDEILPEPFGGAHRDLDATADTIKTALVGALAELAAKDGTSLRNERIEKFRVMGHFSEN